MEKDVKLVVIIEQLKNDDDSVLQYFFQQGIFMYKGRLVMSKTSKLILAILHTYHDSVFGSRSGFLHTYEPLTRELNWEGVKIDINVEECMSKELGLSCSLVGLLLPLAILDQI